MTKSIPERPQLHKTKNRGYVRVRCDTTGKRKTKYFKGEYGSVQMWDDFNAWRRREMGQAVPARPTLDQGARSPSVATASTIYELCSMFLAGVLQDRRHGRTDQSLSDTAEITHTKLALRLLTPYADMAVDDFKTAHLAMARETEIAMGNSCKTINGKIQKIVRMFRKGTAADLCTGETWKKLEAWYQDEKLTPKKHKNVPGPRKVHAAKIDDVLAVAAAAPPTISCMVTVQSTTAMRSANVCGMSWDHIDQSLYEKHGVWKYTPTRHKQTDSGHTLAVFLGPQAIQAILDYENLRPDKGHPFLFNPRASRCWRYFQEQKPQQQRKPTGASLKILNRLKRGPASSADLKKIKPHYRNEMQLLKNLGYSIEVAVAINHRDPSIFTLTARPQRPIAQAKTWRQYYQQSSGGVANQVFSTKSYCDAVQRVQRRIGVDHWTPHQLRHLHNERLVESAFGDSGAAAVLGHNSLEMTRNYSKSQNEPLAAEAQRMLG